MANISFWYCSENIQRRKCRFQNYMSIWLLRLVLKICPAIGCSDPSDSKQKAGKSNYRRDPWKILCPRCFRFSMKLYKTFVLSIVPHTCMSNTMCKQIIYRRHISFCHPKRLVWYWFKNHNHSIGTVRWKKSVDIRYKKAFWSNDILIIRNIQMIWNLENYPFSIPTYNALEIHFNKS